MLAVACAEPPTAEPTPIEDIPNPREVADDAYVITDSGLKYYDFQEGTGNPVKAGDNVSVHYHGWLASGMFIDSSLPKAGGVHVYGRSRRRYRRMG